VKAKHSIKSVGPADQPTGRSQPRYALRYFGLQDLDGSPDRLLLTCFNRDELGDQRS
jgi:hypothetical protein